MLARFFISLTGVAILATPSFAQRRSHDVCHDWENYGPAIPSQVCGGRILPRDEVRHLRNLRLECGSNASHYAHVPFPMKQDDYEHWLDISDDAENAASKGQSNEALKKRQEMQSFRYSIEPDVKWSDQIPYQTFEAWDWTVCVDGPDEAQCGTYQVQETYYVTETDENGHSHQVRKTRWVTKTYWCYHNESRSEKRECSTEVMTYDAKYHRYDPKSEWGPNVDASYLDILPNKYDLMPGEVEDVQIFNTGTSLFSDGTTMSPKVEFGDPWNEYQPRLSPQSFACQYHTTHHLDVEIFTNKRIRKAPPNAFDLPKDPDGSPMAEPVDWSTRKIGPNEVVRVKPTRVLLTDRSSSYIHDLARQSRRFSAEQEKARTSAGTNTNANPNDVRKFMDSDYSSKKGHTKGFMKDTQVEIQLYELPRFEFEIRKTHNLYTSGSVAVRYRSPDRTDQYRIPLMGSTTSTDLYRDSAPLGLEFLSEHFESDLRPGRQYELRIRMGQKGIPFYIDGAWSKPLNVDFTLKKADALDDRGFSRRVFDWWGDYWYKKPFTIGELF